MSINQAMLHGNLGQDPEVRFMQDGKAACNFTMATSDKWKDKQTGEQKERTDWHRVTAFGKLAEVIGQYLKKGDSCVVVGEIRYRKWQDKEGNDKYTTEILANKIDFTKTSGAGQQHAPQQQAPQQVPQQQQPPAGGFDDFEEDLPF